MSAWDRTIAENIFALGGSGSWADEDIEEEIAPVCPIAEASPTRTNEEASPTRTNEEAAPAYPTTQKRSFNDISVDDSNWTTSTSQKARFQRAPRGAPRGSPRGAFRGANRGGAPRGGAPRGGNRNRGYPNAAQHYETTFWEIPLHLNFFATTREDATAIAAAAKNVLDEIKQRIGQVSPWPDVWRRAIETNWVLGRINQACSIKPYSRAFFKMVELARHYPLVPTSRPIKTAHIGEAPGGFFQALLWCCGGDISPQRVEACLTTESDIQSSLVSLPSDSWAPEISGKFPQTRLHSFDMVQNGEARAAFSQSLRGSLDLVTADGGFEVQADRRREQEEIMLPLLRAELDIALQTLNLGGNLVMKFFALDNEPTRCLVSHIVQHFNTAFLTIPLASKPTNDERYVVALGFHGRGAPDIATVLDEEWALWFDMYCMEDKLRQREPLDIAVKLCQTLTVETRIPVEPALGRAKRYCEALGLPIKTFT